MKYFFHANTDKYRRRQKSLMITVLVPFFAICVFCTVNMVLNLRVDTDRSLFMILFGVIVGCVFTGIIFSFAAAYFTEKYSRRHSRYTYFDILPCGVVYSVYAGELVRYGRKVVYRRLYYIPFEKLESVSRDPKTDPEGLTLTGEVREFLLPSDDLGYHVDDNGEITFDHEELNTRGFLLSGKLEISGRFGGTKPLERSVNYYKEQYINRPKKKPFDISEHIMRRKKPAVKTSNPILDAPRYDRKW